MAAPVMTSTRSIAQPTSTPLLRRALRFDAIFTLGASVLFIADSAQLAGLTGVPAAYLLEAGIICLVYAAALWWATKNQPIRQVGWINVVFGYAWVAASIVLLVAGWLPLTSFGFWLIVALAVAVDLITSVQAYALVKRK